VLGAVHGFDGQDAAAVDRPFTWPPPGELKSLRVGYFEADGDAAKRDDLRVLRDLGVTLVPVKLPENKAPALIRFILDVESAAAFDELTRQGVTEGLNSWPATFRRGAFVTATDYLRANRLRTRLMADMERLMGQVDLYVGGDDLAVTNLTGHPTVVLPDGFRKAGGKEVPKSRTFTGRLYGETELLAVASAYQQATGYHRKQPSLPR
jgi:Asp-tRNA(Asn)/Glu-tRNA(Gln) amidotransferase A subunit family amidase